MISNCSTFDGKTVHFSVAIYIPDNQAIIIIKNDIGRIHYCDFSYTCQYAILCLLQWNNIIATYDFRIESNFCVKS